MSKYGKNIFRHMHGHTVLRKHFRALIFSKLKLYSFSLGIYARMHTVYLQREILIHGKSITRPHLLV